MTEFYSGNAYWLLPVLIFFARIADVSIGTVRIVFLARGRRLLAPLCGFVEVMIWLLVIVQVMKNLHSWSNLLAFALGFTAGNYVGLLIEEALAMGFLSVWIITSEDSSKLLERFKEKKYGITQVGARGVMGKVRVLVLVISRRDLKKVLRVVNELNPKAFVTVHDVRTASGGFFPGVTAPTLSQRRRLFQLRK